MRSPKAHGSLGRQLRQLLWSMLLLVCAVGCTAIPQFTGNVIGLLCAEKRDDGVGHKVYAALTFVFDLALLALATISLAGSSYNAFLYFRF